MDGVGGTALGHFTLGVVLCLGEAAAVPLSRAGGNLGYAVPQGLRRGILRHRANRSGNGGLLFVRQIDQCVVFLAQSLVIILEGVGVIELRSWDYPLVLERNGSAVLGVRDLIGGRTALEEVIVVSAVGGIHQA